jgi:hypothetical protein
MRLGLYSERARRCVVAARALIAERDYAADAEGIRRCRQDILALDEGDLRRQVTQWTDFYSASECRDLIFHTQEHRHSPRQISTWLDRLNLQFLGFQLDSERMRRFRSRFPGDDAGLNLELWDEFEDENPDAFRSMYQFWAQKRR